LARHIRLCTGIPTTPIYIAIGILLDKEEAVSNRFVSARATGITAYLYNGGTLENAQPMAAHESRATPSSMTAPVMRAYWMKSNGSDITREIHERAASPERG
jgi:hypothetical protein